MSRKRLSEMTVDELRARIDECNEPTDGTPYVFQTAKNARAQIRRLTGMDNEAVEDFRRSGLSWVNYQEHVNGETVTETAARLGVDVGTVEAARRAQAITLARQAQARGVDPETGTAATWTPEEVAEANERSRQRLDGLARLSRPAVTVNEHGAVMEGDEVRGWVNPGDYCENPACEEAILEGYNWHATPAGFAVTLPTYHFATRDEAIRAIVAAPRSAR